MTTITVLRSGQSFSGHDFDDLFGDDTGGFGTARRYTRVNADGDTLVFRGSFNYDATGELIGAVATSAQLFREGASRPLAELTGVVLDVDDLTTDGSFYGRLGEVEFVGTAGDDTIRSFYSTSATTLRGGAGDDVLEDYVSNRDAYLYGGGGDDLLRPGADFEVASGGSGVDTLDLAAFDVYDSRIVRQLDLSVTEAQELFAGQLVTSTVTGVENAIGGSVRDSLTGSDADNLLFGRYGEDTLRGGGGADTLKGGDDDDTLEGGRGDDLFDGGAGSDLADYSGTMGRVTVDLSNRAAQNTGSTGLDTFVRVENLLGGSNADRLTGDRNGNGIDGGDGADRLAGGAGVDGIGGGGGADTITGGADADVLSGGADDDIFVYARSEDANGDTILDFDLAGNDVIDLSRIDASPAPGNDAFVLVASFTGAGGELVVVRPPIGPGDPPRPSYVQGDLDGDLEVDFTIVLSTTLALPTESDFIL